MKKLASTIWTEKFRPQKINDMLLPPDFTKFFKTCIESGEIPNLLLESSTPGSGKTSIAKAICTELNADYLYLNISVENSIDTLRTLIKQFASNKSFNKKPKIVIMDEFDFATPNLQGGLRAFIEQFHSTCRFILTCNYVAKIIPALREGRMMEFNFNMQDIKYVTDMKPKIVKRLSSILDFEKVEYDNTAINNLVDAHFPNIRKMISLLQKCFKLNGRIDDDIFKLSEVDNELYDLILAKKFTDARAYVVQHSYSYIDLYSKLLTNLVPLLPKEVRGQNIITIAEYEYRTAFSSDPSLQFAACLIEIISTL